ncbi:Holliday junction resolvase RuvX [Candidatus Dependentiae bacterium]|nr:Holliday junction resolvase RuvX [Candidatus Dependentiae bacterium]
MKKLGLDIGDVWVGTALADAMGITCRPFQTVTLQELDQFIEELLQREPIDTVVVGHPITAGGKVSQQTESTEKIFARLKERFKEVSWVLWDERFSTKRAASVTKGRKKNKKGEHSIAAAFVLQSYLDSIAHLMG